MEQHLTLTGTQHHAEGVGVCVSDDPCEKVCEGLTEDVTKEELYTKDSWEGMILKRSRVLLGLNVREPSAGTPSPTGHLFKGNLVGGSLEQTFRN
uniref:Uncharacterized protein n=1 Tax=Nothobranchius kadleci TaxID=1051664 RepID=A0A1A8CG54_NOTKA